MEFHGTPSPAKPILYQGPIHRVFFCSKCDLVCPWRVAVSWCLQRGTKRKNCHLSFPSFRFFFWGGAGAGGFLKTTDAPIVCGQHFSARKAQVSRERHLRLKLDGPVAHVFHPAGGTCGVDLGHLAQGRTSRMRPNGCLKHLIPILGWLFSPQSAIGFHIFHDLPYQGPKTTHLDLAKDAMS